MDNNIDMIIDLWTRVKPVISKKERLEVADAIIAVMDDHGYSDGIENEDSLDKDLMIAIKSHYGTSGEEEYDEDEFDY